MGVVVVETVNIVTEIKMNLAPSTLQFMEVFVRWRLVEIRRRLGSFSYLGVGSVSFPSKAETGMG